MRICPNCGAQNPEQARFCTACGTPLDSLGEERRLVTAVFTDVADVQRRLEPGADPEDFTARLRPFHELLRRQIEGFGGTVEKIVGNVVFGVFGAPVTHEDDAERAIRCRRCASARRCSNAGATTRRRWRCGWASRPARWSSRSAAAPASASA